MVELHTLSELHQKMVELAELHENVYSKNRFKNHRKKKYNNIFFFFFFFINTHDSQHSRERGRLSL